MNQQSKSNAEAYKYETISLVEENDRTIEARGWLTLAGLDTSQLVLAGITEIKLSKELAQDLQEDLFRDSSNEGLFTPNVNEKQMIRALEVDEKKGFILGIEERAKILIKDGVVGLSTERARKFEEVKK